MQLWLGGVLCIFLAVLGVRSVHQTRLQHPTTHTPGLNRLDLMGGQVPGIGEIRHYHTPRARALIPGALVGKQIRVAFPQQGDFFHCGVIFFSCAQEMDTNALDQD